MARDSSMDMELNRNLVMLRLKLSRERGALAHVTELLARANVAVASMDLVEAHADHIVRDIVISVETDGEAEAVAKSLETTLAGQVEVLSILDRILAIHQGGKMQIASRVALENHRDLSRIYTPGVGKVCMEIVRDPSAARKYTCIPNTVAVITDGTAVLGFGDIGPAAGMPVMEGKALLFKRFANLDAIPILLGTKEVEPIVETITNIAPTFGGLNLEDISAPRCFEIEERLRKTLSIPVFHDDQHGTAIISGAALVNALELTGKKIEDVKVVFAGAGAAAIGCVRLY
ncbi:MAG: NAD-dependent malic enzyme, partial [Candidatus Methylomirabilis sp.]|nr:NAD-dependent malic enzyme [Deltaproteobacteria bacterium]